MSITVFSLPSCVQCDRTKQVLDRAEITYNVVDLDKDREARRYVQELGYMAAPVVVAGDTHWSGFRPDRLNELKALVDISA